MATTLKEIIGQTRGGLYYTDEIIGNSASTSLTCEQLIATSDADLIDTRINQTSARHIKGEVVIVRGKL